MRDSIEFSTFLSPTGAYGQTPPVAFSPDNSRFVVVTMRGDLTTGKREATMWLFDSKAARTYLSAGSSGDFEKPKLLTKFASAANREPLRQWRWSKDSHSVLFLAADDDGAERFYRVNVETGAVAALSRADQDVSKFDERNGGIVYFAHVPVRAADLYQAGGPTLPDILDGTGQSLLPLLFPNWMDTIFRRSDDELWKVEHGKPVPVTDNGHQVVHVKDSRLVLSPDGRSLLVTPFVKHIPKLWEQYQPLEDYPGLRILADTAETEGSTGHYRPQEYALVDLSSGKQSLLVDAPIELLARFSDLQPQWSQDGSRIALPMVYPPLDSDSKAAQYSVLPCSIMVVDLRTQKRSCVQVATPIDAQKTKYGDRMQMVSLRWQNSDHELIAEYAAPNAPDKKSTTLFTQNGDAWTAKNLDVLPAHDELSITVQEGIDEPPVVVARIGKGNARRIFDPNPQLKQIALGTAAMYSWRDSDGDEWTGALVKPPEFSTSRRYPLVIQTHGLDRSKFLIDGPSATGFAARVFAGHDIVVLQVDEINKNSGTGKEAETGAAGYRAAILQLAHEGVVDPARVGIISWSHFGPQVFQGLIDDAHTYSAATIAESTYDSYGEYLMNIDYMGKEREQMFRALYGAKPFGPGLQNWVEHSPGFHSDRICAPLLFQFNSPASLVYGWDMYAALRAQDKPVDLFYIRNGDHVLVKPRERLEEQTMNVDWYDYWLNGHKDNNPAKADQYKRWDAMKTLPRCSEPRADR